MFIKFFIFVFCRTTVSGVYGCNQTTALKLLLKMKKILYIFLIVSLVGCQENSTKKKTVNANGSFETETLSVNDKTPLSIVDSISFIPIKESENSLFINIDKILVKKNSIFIMDKLSSRALLKFSKLGEFITKFENIGQGPGEYVRLWDFDVTDKFVLSVRQKSKKNVAV